MFEELTESGFYSNKSNNSLFNYEYDGNIAFLTQKILQIGFCDTRIFWSDEFKKLFEFFLRHFWIFILLLDNFISFVEWHVSQNYMNPQLS